MVVVGKELASSPGPCPCHVRHTRSNHVTFWCLTSRECQFLVEFHITHDTPSGLPGRDDTKSGLPGRDACQFVEGCGLQSSACQAYAQNDNIPAICAISRLRALSGVVPPITTVSACQDCKRGEGCPGAVLRVPRQMLALLGIFRVQIIEKTYVQNEEFPYVKL